MKAVNLKWRPVAAIGTVVIIILLFVQLMTSGQDDDGPAADSSWDNPHTPAPGASDPFADKLEILQAVDAEAVELKEAEQALEDIQGKIKENKGLLAVAEKNVEIFKSLREKEKLDLKTAKMSLLNEKQEVLKLKAKAAAPQRQKRDTSNENNNEEFPYQLPPSNIGWVDSRPTKTAISPAEVKKLSDKSFEAFAFNEYESSQQSLRRSISDTRLPKCRSISYDVAALPQMSVIICFVNEAWSALLRTVWSVLDRTPAHLLREIILMDDASDEPWTQSPLEEYIRYLPSKVKIVRSDKRLGLIRARMVGATHASGEILTFLDSHCEANVGWAEPILAWMKEDRRRVVCPSIDVIKADNMQYQSSGGSARGTFHWTLDFAWEGAKRRPGQQMHEAVESPTMAGGLFSINREYFYEIGTYDDKMDGWGGENLEMSFRIWQCGGTLHILPCSRVGHIFRSRHPYKIPGSSINKTFLRNSIRLAEVWMEEYKDIFYDIRPFARTVDFGDVSERLAWKKKMKCKSFKWFLDTMQPGKFIPTANTVIAKGQLKHGQGNKCLDKGAGNFLYPCHPKSTQSLNQAFWYTNEKEIRFVWDTCLHIQSNRISLSGCSGHSTKFDYRDAEEKIMVNGKCMDVVNNKIVLATCNDSPSQKWKFTGELNA